MHNNYNRIRELRDKNGKSQKITAELLGYQTTTYQRWEQEIHNIKLKEALKIALYYLELASELIINFFKEELIIKILLGVIALIIKLIIPIKIILSLFN